MLDILPSPLDTAAALGLDRNGIMWCDATLNPGLAGCAYASPACGTADRSSQCYAEATAAGIVRKGRSEKAAPGALATAEFCARGLTPEGRWTGRVHVDPTRIAPAFAKLPKKASERVRRVFVTSMSDLFHVEVPTPFLDAVFAEMAARPWIVFQVLTKRAEIMFRYAEWRTRNGWTWPANVWAGCTVEDQRRADERIPYLLKVPAAVWFLSVEPMLGRIDLTRITKWGGSHVTNSLTGDWRLADLEEGCDSPTLSWVIIGSESNGPRPGKRETRPEWVLDLVDQCDASRVPVFVKQLAIDGRLCTLPLIRGKVRAAFPEVPRA